jgi:hypothetical protein
MFGTGSYGGNEEKFCNCVSQCDRSRMALSFVGVCAGRDPQLNAAVVRPVPRRRREAGPTSRADLFGRQAIC